jgi:outer membrane lipoprotein LolB
LPLELNGRFSTTYTASLPETKRESASGRFELFKDASRLTVDLISPFGQTIARAEHKIGSPATLQTADNRRFTGASLDEVFERAIGIRVPAEKLPDWLSDRFEEVVERSADGSRIKARDAGWDIERSGIRWDLVWHEGTQRIEVRLLLDAR